MCSRAEPIDKHRVHAAVCELHEGERKGRVEGGVAHNPGSAGRVRRERVNGRRVDG